MVVASRPIIPKRGMSRTLRGRPRHIEIRVILKVTFVSPLPFMRFPTLRPPRPMKRELRR